MSTAIEQLLVDVAPRHRVDTGRLARWLRETLPSAFDGEVSLRMFQGGQSNPTYCVQTNVGTFVLRKKPNGPLLASAHAIDREYRVMHALAGTGVPVPRMVGYCTDEGVVGTPFYVMAYAPGRVLGERLVPPDGGADQRTVQMDMVRILAALHTVDWRAQGLGDFGRPDNYMQRQVARWSRQLEASLVEDWPAVQRLSEWLPAHLPDTDEATLVHGDYRLGNVLVTTPSSRVSAVIDWELSTIGHPLADLGYFCITYQLPSMFGGCLDLDLKAHGIPSQKEVVDHYGESLGRPIEADLSVYVAFAMFRLAAIGAGVYRRALDGNAANDHALAHWKRYQYIGEAAWRLAQRIEAGIGEAP